MANQMMQRRVHDFQSFLGEMNNGIMAIANAAQVVAYCYDGTDSENGATIGDVSFAFGADGSRKPDGFDNRLLYNENVTTMEQMQALAAAQAGQNVGSYGSLYGNRDGGDLAYSTPYGSMWKWPDGSSVTSSAHTEIGAGGQTVYVTTYTVTDKDGKVLGTRTERSSFNSDGSKFDSTEISNGGRTTRDDTTTYHDGHVQTTSTTSQTGPDGKPMTTTTTHETRPEDHTVGSGGRGPVETAQDTYDTQGDDESKRLYGMDY